jgi:hypothetical protein
MFKNCSGGAALTANESAREARLRRLASRQGLAVRKSRAREPRAIEYGLYGVIDPYSNTWVSQPFSMTLDGLEEFLSA